MVHVGGVKKKDHELQVKKLQVKKLQPVVQRQGLGIENTSWIKIISNQKPWEILFITCYDTISILT